MRRLSLELYIYIFIHKLHTVHASFVFLTEPVIYLCKFHSVTARNDERKVKAAANNKHAEKIGYVPRNKQAASMQASGLSSAGMMGKGRNDPDQVHTCLLGLSRTCWTLCVLLCLLCNGATCIIGFIAASLIMTRGVRNILVANCVLPFMTVCSIYCVSYFLLYIHLTYRATLIKRTGGQALDEDSAAGMARLREKDAEIDAGIDSISRTIDNLSSIGAAMKDEVRYRTLLFACLVVI